ncbi:hypothetical protein [Halovenus salina]|uniref:Archaeal glycosylation protein B peripheral domain-containing protein n=1 Tax=Halovenus salina TaxID=1510225 RepID=A0ABD5W0U7_9EURY
MGYVVLLDQDLPTGTTHSKLFEKLGAGNNSVAHFQLIYSSPDVRTFAVVPGAVVQVQTSPGANVTAKTTVETAGEQFTYRRTTTANDTGTATIRVAYPGKYTVGSETVTVAREAVYEGATVSVSSEDDGT